MFFVLWIGLLVMSLFAERDVESVFVGEDSLVLV